MNKEQQELLDEAYENYCISYKDGHEFYEDEEVKRSFTQVEFINKCKTNPEFSEKWGLKIEERELSLEERLPKKIKLNGYGEIVEFSLTNKREIKVKPKNGSLIDELDENWLTREKLKDNEVFYQTEFGWGVFFNTDTFETISYDGTEWGGHKLNTSTKLITITYNNKTITNYE